ncbi:hypothetical protein A3F66_03485 [candidate division TM6 bacterium RIFCSPHIGHO2_12_FULL_32_22]|nr:MAG: hypothetical protein A3F66_03485 [candidate division TM6 bacterium RIFCSPHIGHO2_12_FULL_32_22]
MKKIFLISIFYLNYSFAVRDQFEKKYKSYIGKRICATMLSLQKTFGESLPLEMKEEIVYKMIIEYIKDFYLLIKDKECIERFLKACPQFKAEIYSMIEYPRGPGLSESGNTGFGIHPYFVPAVGNYSCKRFAKHDVLGEDIIEPEGSFRTWLKQANKDELESAKQHFMKHQARFNGESNIRKFKERMELIEKKLR